VAKDLAWNQSVIAFIGFENIGYLPLKADIRGKIQVKT
jgi:hypothetical protein